MSIRNMPIPPGSSNSLGGKFPNSSHPDHFHGGDARTFEELLDTEVVVDLARLREASRLGVHPRYRGMVYRYLLGVTLPDKSSEMSMERAQERDFELLRRPTAYTQAGRPVKGNGGKALVPSYAPYLHPPTGAGAFPLTDALVGDRGGAACGMLESKAAWERAISEMQHLAPFSHSPESRQWLDAVLESLQTIHSCASREDIFTLMHLVLPFKTIKSSAKDAFYCVNTVYYLLTHHGNPLQDDECLQQHCGNFMMLFHTLNVMLYRHFFTEGITTLEWVPRMLCTLLADRLHQEDLLRIWDYYLADPGETLTFSLHPFVCLALLFNMAEDLVECDKMEILYRLEHMPRINAEAVLQKAISIREDVYTRGLLFS